MFLSITLMLSAFASSAQLIATVQMSEKGEGICDHLPSNLAKVKETFHDFLIASKISNTIPDRTLISILSAP